EREEDRLTSNGLPVLVANSHLHGRGAATVSDQDVGQYLEVERHGQLRGPAEPRDFDLVEAAAKLGQHETSPHQRGTTRALPSAPAISRHDSTLGVQPRS